MVVLILLICAASGLSVGVRNLILLDLLLCSGPFLYDSWSLELGLPGLALFGSLTCGNSAAI